MQVPLKHGSGLAAAESLLGKREQIDSRLPTHLYPVPAQSPTKLQAQIPVNVVCVNQGVQSRCFPAASNRSQPVFPVSFPPRLQPEQSDS